MNRLIKNVAAVMFGVAIVGGTACKAPASMGMKSERPMDTTYRLQSPIGIDPKAVNASERFEITTPKLDVNIAPTKYPDPLLESATLNS